MKTIKRIIVYAMAMTLFCCYDYDNKIELYKSQEHDPDVIGWWLEQPAPDENGNSEYYEYNNNSKRYGMTRLADGSLSKKFGYDFWHTKNNRIYYLIPATTFSTSHETSAVYELSEDKSILTIGDNNYIRTEMPTE